MYSQRMETGVQERFVALSDSELSMATFSFYTSVSAVFSSKIEGEPIDLDSYIKHKRLGAHFLPDYTRKIDDLYEAYIFAQQHKLNKANLLHAHALLTRNILQKGQQGKIRAGNMFVITQDGKIEYVAAAPDRVKAEMEALYQDIATLLKSELEALPSQYHPRLRFLGKNTYKILPINLQSNWMPYDDRLEGVGKGYSGTQSDFAQRALKHFVYEVLPMDPTGDAQVHQTITLGFLSNIGKSEKVKGLKKSDDEIVALIKKHWNNGFTGATQVLRIFRGHLGVACEQSRFRDLYKSTKESINAKQ